MQLDKSKRQMEERKKDERNYTINLLYTSQNPKIVLNKDRPFLHLDFWYFKKCSFYTLLVNAGFMKNWYSTYIVSVFRDLGL